MKTYRLILVAVAVALAVAGCRTNKTGVTGGRDWHNVVMPARLNLEGGKSMGASGRLTMVRDESVYLSVRMLGMELFSLYAAGDSLWAYDRMSGTLVGERLGHDPVKGGRLDIHRLQDLLLCSGGKPDSFSTEAWRHRVLCEAADTVMTPYGVMRGGWKAEIEDMDVSAEVSWGLRDAQWNKETVGEWKRPRNAKRVINGSAELLKWLGAGGY
ncbi:MAG: DUF4292 domain-containing protein [Muribaculaceae bacterium]|nr:DUF4292 domain-containing protein [Muribaculaceae bacterium]